MIRNERREETHLHVSWMRYRLNMYNVDAGGLMNEYIVDTSDIVQDFAVMHVDTSTPSYRGIMCVLVSRQREPIVRCRDCKYSAKDRSNTAIGEVGAFVCVSEQWSTSSLMPSHKVEPDGFCKWGERK